MSTVKNMTNDNFRAIPNQFIIDEENKVTFQSYSTTIAWYDRDSKVVSVTPMFDYSQTTLKYFKQFLREECGFNGTYTKSDLYAMIKDGRLELVDA